MPPRSGSLSLAYLYARRHATNQTYSFGTGKVGDLFGFFVGVDPDNHRSNDGVGIDRSDCCRLRLHTTKPSRLPQLV